MSDTPLISKADRSALIPAMTSFEVGLLPIDPRWIEPMLARVSLAFPTSKLSEAEAGARLELYTEGLSDLPRDILQDAFREAVRACKWFPTVSELREFAAPEFNKRRARLMFLKRLADRFDREPPERTDYMPPAEAAAALRSISATLGEAFPTARTEAA